MMGTGERFAYQVLYTFRDTSLHGRGEERAMVAFFLPTPPGMNDYGMTMAEAVRQDERFEGWSKVASLRGARSVDLDEGRLVKVVEAVTIEGRGTVPLTPDQIRARCRERWASLKANLDRELPYRYRLAGLREELP